jgi:hypothetical protein
MSYRDEALARLDVRAFMASQGVLPGKKVGTDEFRFLCPFHGDTDPSANWNVRSGLWKCQVCGKGGSPIDFLMEKGLDYKAALVVVGEAAGLPAPGAYTNGAAAATAAPATTSITKGKLTEANVKGWHEAALRNVDLMHWLEEKRGYTRETIERYQIGWNGQRVTIPIRDEAAKLINVRLYLRNATGEQGKMLPLMVGSGPDVTTRLFPMDPVMPDEVFLVEGEWDAMIARQYGIEGAMTVTIGAGNWNPTFTPLFADRTVIIGYDNDDAGRNGAVRVAAILSSAEQGTRVRILQIPNLPSKGDVTDFFVEQNRSPEELRTLIAESSPYLAAPTAVTEGPALRVPLHRASDAIYRGQRQELPVLLSGKAMTPFTVPYEMNVHCDMGNKRFCGVCPMQEVSGNRDVTLTPSDPAVLSLIGVTTAAQYAAIKELAKAVHQCNHPQVTIKKAINIEELRLIPELDSAIEAAGDTEYVARQGFFLGHGLLPNRSYMMRGYTHPHPKNQSTVHLLSEAEPSQDNISAFEMGPELANHLKLFQAGADVDGRWRDLYADFAATVHRIQDRFDMQVAYDLAWHSVISFHFNGAYVRRGWVETMVMGDSGQGKTEMADNLLAHYGLGERLPAEQTSMAGLIGGLEKMGDTWMLGWGRIPLNDKRLLVIDEAQGLASSAIEAMSDVRASGVAEITKIRTEKTNARCRLIWLANPVSGLTLAQHNQGVVAIKELFKKPEDVRRLDFAMTVASGDVDYARSINIRHASATTPRYSSALSRSLLLWAWSRRADQIDFLPDATDLILSVATDMGRRYHPSIPLVEPSDQRLKLARLAAAAAARVFSTDEAGERVIVGVEHVAFVAEYLDRIYSSPSMAYGEYSEAMKRGEALEPSEENAVRRTIADWSMSDDAVSFLRNASKFRKSDLIDVVGWDDAYAKLQLKLLAANRLIRPVRDGYVKSPAFIALLRTSREVPEGTSPDDDDAPF